MKASKRPNKSLITFDDGRQIHRKVRYLMDGRAYVRVRHEVYLVEKRGEGHYHVIGKA